MGLWAQFYLVCNGLILYLLYGRLFFMGITTIKNCANCSSAFAPVVHWGEFCTKRCRNAFHSRRAYRLRRERLSNGKSASIETGIP